MIVELPSLPLKIISLSATGEKNCAPAPELEYLNVSVPPSKKLTSPPSASRMMFPVTSSVKSPASEIVEPLIVISSTVRAHKVPTLVILG